MASVRKTVGWLLAGCAALTVSPVVGQFFVAWADEKGLYEQPSARVDQVVTWLASITALPGYYLVLGLIFGSVFGFWLDVVARRIDMWRGQTTLRSPVVTQALPCTPVDKNAYIASIGRSAYVGRVAVSAGGLSADRLLEFSFVAQNVTDSPLRMTGVEGRIHYRGKSDVHDLGFVGLPPPMAREGNSTDYGPFAEFMVIIVQRVSGEIATAIERDLATGGMVKFNLRNLDIRLQSSGQDQPERLAVWDQIECDQVVSAKLGPMIQVGRVHTVTASASATSGEASA